MSRRIRGHLRGNVVGYVALFVALSGSAYAVNGPLPGVNQVGSADIINGEVKSPDVQDNGLVGNDIANNDSLGSAEIGELTGVDIVPDSLNGTDVLESSLGEVPAATLGGIGRWTSPSGACNPESASFFTCAFTSIDLPKFTRVLIIGVVKAQGEGLQGADGSGQCLLATHLFDIPESTSGFEVGGILGRDVAPFLATTMVGPGPIDFAIRCNELSGNIQYFDPAVTAVALSPN